MFVTCHIQKDKRITLGTCGHKYKDCPSLKGRMSYDISGGVAEIIRKCEHCYTRMSKEIK